jgi:hypothetical protein
VSDRANGPNALLGLVFVYEEGLSAELGSGLDHVVCCVLAV